VERKLVVVRQVVTKNLQEEEAKLDRLDELELKDLKTERFFMHNFWMRAFSLLFAPTLLLIFLQLNQLGATYDEIIGFSVSLIVAMLILGFFLYVSYKSI